MENFERLMLLAIAILGAINIGGIVLKRMDRKKDSASVDSTAVETMKSVLQEVRTEDGKKAIRLEKLEERVDKLEERERGHLTRAAVHEAWDQMAFAMLIATNPNHPAPPPILPEGYKRDD